VVFHVGLLHLGFNMLTLIPLGRCVCMCARWCRYTTHAVSCQCGHMNPAGPAGHVVRLSRAAQVAPSERGR